MRLKHTLELFFTIICYVLLLGDNGRYRLMCFFYVGKVLELSGLMEGKWTRQLIC